jgi:hypothetical protein
MFQALNNSDISSSTLNVSGLTSGRSWRLLQETRLPRLALQNWESKLFFKNFFCLICYYLRKLITEGWKIIMIRIFFIFLFRLTFFCQWRHSAVLRFVCPATRNLEPCHPQFVQVQFSRLLLQWAMVNGYTDNVISQLM